MTEEEQKAIKTIKSLKEVRCYSSYAFDDGTEILDEEEKKDIDVILNLISKLQEENKELREGKDTAENELKSQLKENKKLQSDIEKRISFEVIKELKNKIDDKISEVETNRSYGRYKQYGGKIKLDSYLAQLYGHKKAFEMLLEMEKNNDTKNK